MLQGCPAKNNFLISAVWPENARSPAVSSGQLRSGLVMSGHVWGHTPEQGDAVSTLRRGPTVAKRRFSSALEKFQKNLKKQGALRRKPTFQSSAYLSALNLGPEQVMINISTTESPKIAVIRECNAIWSVLQFNITHYILAITDKNPSSSFLNYAVRRQPCPVS